MHFYTLFEVDSLNDFNITYILFIISLCANEFLPDTRLPAKVSLCEQAYIWVYVCICLCVIIVFAHNGPAFIGNRKWRSICFLISLTRRHTTCEQLWQSSLCQWLLCLPCHILLLMMNLSKKERLAASLSQESSNLLMEQLFANSKPGKRWLYWFWPIGSHGRRQIGGGIEVWDYFPEVG